MLQRDHVLVGMGVSLFFAFTFWFGLNYLNDSMTGGELFGNTFGGFREQFMATMAVFSTIVPFMVYLRSRKDDSMRGVGIVTIILALIVVFRYFI